MSSLDTITLSENPSHDDIKARCNGSPVRKYMHLDSVWCSPVYMVTSIKVAKDFKLEGAKSFTNGIEGESCGQITPDASVGCGAGISKTKRIADGFEAKGDVIFAYQLMKIKPKGWGKEKEFKTSEFEHRQAFLEGGTSGADENVEELDGEVEAVTRDDLKALPGAQIEEIDGVVVGYELPRVAN